MTILLEEFPVPQEKGRFSFSINRICENDNGETVTIPQNEITVEIRVSAVEAKRKVSGWLIMEVSMMMGGEPPSLVIRRSLNRESSQSAVWRTPAVFTAPHVGVVGQIGEIDVDVMTGELYDLEAKKPEVLAAAKKLAKKLPRYKHGAMTNDKGLVHDLKPTRPVGKPTGDPDEIIRRFTRKNEE